MHLSRALTWIWLAQTALCIFYSNSTKSQPLQLNSAPSSAFRDNNRLSTSLQHHQDATGSTGGPTTAETTTHRPSASITPLANLSTITKAPDFPCGRNFTFNADFGGVSWCLNCPQKNGTWAQELPENTCSACSTGSSVSGSWSSAPRPQWVWTSGCYVKPGTVSLFYWPTGTPNATYASTIYNEALGVTFTSPSVYYVLNTISASNACGPVGPTAKNAVFAYDLKDVTTWSPTVSGEMTAGHGPLQLSDLAENCPTTGPTEEEASAYDAIPVNRCNPRLQWPMKFERFGYPYWKHCAAHRNRFGVFDPPVALTQAAAAVVPTMPSQPSPKLATPASGASATASLPSSTTAQFEVAASHVSISKDLGQATPSKSSVVPVAVESEDASTPWTTVPTLTQHGTSANVAEIIANVISAARAVTSTNAEQQSSAEDRKDHIEDTSKDYLAATSRLKDIFSDFRHSPAKTPLTLSTSGAFIPSSGGEVSTARADASNMILVDPGSTVTAKIGTRSSLIEGHIFKSSGYMDLLVDWLAANKLSATAQAGAKMNLESTLTLHQHNAMTLAGQNVEIVSGMLLVGTKTFSLTNGPAAAPAATISGSYGQLSTLLVSGDAVVLPGAASTKTIDAGGRTTFAGEEIEIRSSSLRFGTSTIRRAAAEAPGAVVAALPDASTHTWTVVSASNGFIVEDASTTVTLHAGEVTTFGGKTSMAQGTRLVAGTSTGSFLGEQPNFTTTTASISAGTSDAANDNSTVSISVLDQGSGNAGNSTRSSGQRSPANTPLLLFASLYSTTLVAVLSV